MARIVQPTSASFEEILSDLKSFVNSNSTRAWKDFTASSAGSIVTELMAGLAAFLHNDVLMARLEADKDSARLRSSIMGLASFLGYPIKRRSAPKLKITIQLEGESQVSLPRFEPIGSFKSLPIVPLKDYILSPGTNEVYCAVGEWKRHQFTLPEAEDFARYYFKNPYVENDIRWSPVTGAVFPLLELNVSYQQVVANNENEIVTERVKLVEYADQLDSESCLLKTYIDGVLMLFGDGAYGRKILLTDSIEFIYLQTQGLLQNVKVSDLDTGFSIKVGSFSNVQLLFPGSNPDGIEKLRTLMSGYHASRRRMVTEEDHRSLLLSYPGVVSANVRRIDPNEAPELAQGCCSVEATVLFEDGHALDSASNEEIASGVITVTPETIFYQDSDIHPSSLRLSSNGFTDALTTGTRIWLNIISNDPPNDTPQGLQSGRFYHIIRIEGTNNIRFATDQIRAFLGIYVQLTPPLSGDVIDCKFGINTLADTAKTRDALSAPDTVVLETNVNYASSFQVSSSFFSAIQTGDALLISVDGSTGKLYPEDLPRDQFAYAIRIPENNRVQLASDKAKANSGDRISLEDHPILNFNGTVYFDQRTLREDVVVSNASVVFSDGVSEPGYLDISTGAPNLNAKLSSTPLKVRISRGTGGTVLPNNLLFSEARVLWIYNPSGSRISFAETEADALAQNGIELRSPGTDLTGVLTFDVFEGEQESINISPSSGKFISESAFAYSSSVNLGDPPFWVNDVGAEIYAGMKVRIHSEGNTVLPQGLDLGEFYYAIPLAGTNRIRFAETFNKATGANNTPVEYIELTAPLSGSMKGFLQIDFFLDSSEYVVNPSNLFFQDAQGYFSSINVGRSHITGTPSNPGGYFTGTKIRLFNQAQGGTLPGGLKGDIYYYLIRLPGMNNIRFAKTRSNALRGIYEPLAQTAVENARINIAVYDSPEERKLRAYLERFHVVGLRLLFVDAVPVVLRPQMTVVIDSASNLAAVQKKIREVLEKYTFSLANVFHVGKVYKEISSLNEVLRIYIKKPISDIALVFNEYLTLPVDLFTPDLIRIEVGEDAFVDLNVFPEDSDGYDD